MDIQRLNAFIPEIFPESFYFPFMCGSFQSLIAVILMLLDILLDVITDYKL